VNKTGRLQRTGFAMQVPGPQTEFGRRLRETFSETFSEQPINVDYTEAELRMLAHSAEQEKQA
jgi:DNA polymerase I-like protein with 3'-5' exonuclease and polymerase domains